MNGLERKIEKERRLRIVGFNNADRFIGKEVRRVDAGRVSYRNIGFGRSAVKVEARVVAASPARGRVIPEFLVARVVAKKCVKSAVLRCIGVLVKSQVPLTNLQIVVFN